MPRFTRITRQFSRPLSLLPRPEPIPRFVNQHQVSRRRKPGPEGYRTPAACRCSRLYANDYLSTSRLDRETTSRIPRYLRTSRGTYSRFENLYCPLEAHASTIRARDSRRTEYQLLPPIQRPRLPFEDERTRGRTRGRDTWGEISFLLDARLRMRVTTLMTHQRTFAVNISLAWTRKEINVGLTVDRATRGSVATCAVSKRRSTAPSVELGKRRE